MMRFITSALLASTSVAFEVPSLTADTYDELTEGKTVFLKFFSPGCGYCKKMAPDWEKLAEEWNNSPFVLVAEVDCQAEGKVLCEANGIRGYPTMKFGDPAVLEDYNGGRSYSDLSKFATENLKPACSVANIELCDADKKVQIENYIKLSVEELTKSIEEEVKKLEKAEKDFKAAVANLQAKYQKLKEDKEKTITSVKHAGLALMKSVLVAKGESTFEDEKCGACDVIV